MLFLLSVAFAIATALQSEARTWRSRSSEGGLMGMLLGDGRRMFANQFTAKADQYFHSGYYPSIFDQRPESPEAAGHVHDENCEHDHEPAAAAKSADATGHVHDDTCGHDHDPGGACAAGCDHSHLDHSVEACEEKSGGWQKPTDWVARFGSNFRVTEHTHLGGTDSREMLPWLQIAAELDPRQISTYLVGSYWLRQANKSAEAEAFIRQGLEANPRNSELLMELGRIYLQDRKNTERAHRLFELALQSWDEFERPKEKPDFVLLSNIASNLARIEEEKGDLAAAIGHLERAREGSPYSDALARQIEEIKQRVQPSSTNNPPSGK
jgi:tetratricopeptide (TPR) repeat protein